MLNHPGLENFEKITTKNIPTENYISQGHRACQGCAEILALGMVMKIAGPNTIVANATGCMEIVTSPFPQTAWKVPWIHVAFENTAAVASGIEAGIKALKRKERFKNDPPHVIAVGGDGATADIGLQSLSGALERGHNFLYVCLDNEAYMNTGIQRSSSTPYGASTTTSPTGSQSIGQQTWKKDLPAIAAAHNIPYVATANPGFHLDLMNKVKKALTIEGPAYIHIYSACPTGWRSKPEKSIEISKLAVQTNVFPLYEIINGRLTITKKINKPKPVREYLKTQRRFGHLSDNDINFIQQRTDARMAELQSLESSSQE
ncbi:pyruvate synthase subunit PorB [Desulfonatronovibrio hydrogenovorans]|uniref:pyruvate synthase subunit PorB n=1 Tax=Desulfonatronovibrio hydrogenovorans TaxID=53245 RepID=UPI00048F5B76|nr:pyruvate synthase subunit PorB [Desulfonatronovibrio hydrogenovorans]